MQRFFEVRSCLPTSNQMTPNPGHTQFIMDSESNISLISFSSTAKVEVVRIEQYALFIRNLCKQYGESIILRNLCMTVKCGEIYSLLGASGCGKTSLLSCILGKEPSNSGDLLIFGVDPYKSGRDWINRQIGYMPQELALYMKLTAGEIVRLYALFYNVDREQARDKWDFLKKLLDITYDDILIGQMSGGQKRRISLALALIHSPKLLLLDEPTVGLDPLLRQRVWEYLKQVNVTDKVTTIITTHYVEETRRSNTIGVLRKGRIIAEDSPQNLLNRFDCSLLEQVVLNLCRIDNDQTVNENTIQYVGNPYSPAAATYNFQKNTSILASFNRTCAYIAVLLLMLMRQPVFLVVILWIPAIYMTLALLTVGSSAKNLQFSVVNHETNACSEYIPSEHHNCDFWRISCKFLDRLTDDNFVILTDYATEEEALASVQRGKSWGYIVIPENYSINVKGRFVERLFASNASILGSQLKTRMDFSQSLIAFFLSKHFYQTLQDFLVQMTDDCNYSRADTQLPIDWGTAVHGSYDLKFTDYVLSGFIVLALFSAIGPLTSLMLISDIKQGTLSRARLAGLTITDLLWSLNAVFGLIVIVSILISTIVFLLGFDIAIHGNLWIYFFMFWLTGMCFVALGILIAIKTQNEIHAIYTFLFFYVGLIILGGAIYPMENIPWVWRQFGYSLPTSLAINALRTIIVRGLGFEYHDVWGATLGLLGWTLLFSLAAVKLLKMSNT